MAGWDGSGNVVRNYSWAADAAAGIKISSSRMDTEFNMLTDAIENSLARDGQNKPSANIDWNAKRIVNLADGVDPADAATVGQLTGVGLGGAASEWVPEYATPLYVTHTLGLGTFKLLATDATSTWHPGRRMRCVISGTGNLPNHVWLGTVISSSYSAPDTTIIAYSDGGIAALDNGMASVTYGIQASDYRGAPLGTIVNAYSTATTAVDAGGTAKKVTIDTEAFDLLNEFNTTTSRFTALYRGYYFVSFKVQYKQTGSGTMTLRAQVCESGASMGTGEALSFGTVEAFNNGTSYGANGYNEAMGSGIVRLSTADYLELFVKQTIVGVVTGSMMIYRIA